MSIASGKNVGRVRATQSVLLEREELLSQLHTNKPTDVIEVGAKSMPYQSLTPEGFELLLWDMFYSGYDKSELQFDKARLMITGADKGRDVWLTNQGVPVGLVQCKREEKKFSRSAALKEVIKFLLHTELDSKLLPHPDEFTYYLALSNDPQGDVDDFFEDPVTWLKSNKTDIQQQAESVKGKYATFRDIDINAISRSLHNKIQAIHYQLLRPHELSRWLDIRKDVRERHFTLPGAQILSFHDSGYFSITDEHLKEASLPLICWQRTIENKFIERPELERLERKIETEESKCYLLTGGAGSGKSSLLSLLYERLIDGGKKVLAIKADELDKDINDLSDLASFLKLKYDGGLAHSLLEASMDSPFVLIIDQMDAVSEVMDQSSNRFRVLIDLILSFKQLFDNRKVPPIHIVTSSRPFEASFDTRFTQLEADEIELTPPSKDAVEKFLEEIGISKNTVPASMYPTIQVPFALNLYISLVKAGDNQNEITSKNLLSRWLEKKLTNPKLRDLQLSFLRLLAADMIRDEVLRRPISAYLLEHQSTISALEAAGILVRYGNNIGFSHQAWLDDFQSQSFRCGDDLYNFVMEKQNGLFSRSTILRGIEYLREHNQTEYHRAMDRLLFDKSVRRHIYHLLVDVIASSSVPNFNDAERVLRIIEHDKVLALRVISKVAGNWLPWRELLLDHIPDLMKRKEFCDSVIQWLVSEAKYNEEYVVSLVARLWGGVEHDAVNFSVLSRSKASSLYALQLATKIIQRTRIDTYSISRYIIDLFGDSNTDSAFKLFECWVCTEGEKVLFERVFGIDKYVDEYPARFGEILMPWAVGILETSEVEKENARKFRRSTSLGSDWENLSDNDGMLGVLQKSLINLALKKPLVFLEFVDRYAHVDFDEVQSMLVVAFSSNAKELADDIGSYLLGEDSRLCIGSGYFQDDENVSFHVIGNLTMMLLEEASPYWSSSQVELIKQAIEQYICYPPEAQDTAELRRIALKYSEKYRLMLLARLPSESLDPRRRRQVSERDTTHEPKIGERCRGIGMASIVTSPMSAEQMGLASTSDIMQLMNELSNTSESDPNQYRWRRFGGLSEFSRAFSSYAASNPQKAISILEEHFVVGPHEKIAGDAIEELAKLQKLDAIKVKSLITKLNNRGFKSKEWIIGVARAFEEIAKKDKGLEAQDIELLVSYLNVDFDSDEWSTDKFDGDIDGGILFGRGGGSRLRTPGNSNILSAIYMGLLCRKKPDHDLWVDIITKFFALSKNEEVWEFILLIQGEQLYWADKDKVNALISNVFTTIPRLFSTPGLVHTIWGLADRLKPELVMSIVELWLQSESKACNQAAAELLSGLLISNRGSDQLVKCWEKALESKRVSIRRGGIFAACAGWYDIGEIRGNAHQILMNCLSGEIEFVATALNSVFSFNKYMPQDELTLEFLKYISETPALIKKIDTYRLLNSLVRINPSLRTMQVVLKIAKIVIEQKQEGGSEHIYFESADKLVELSVTLQRSGGLLKEEAMTLYEQLLDAGTYQAEEAAEAASRS